MLSLTRMLSKISNPIILLPKIFYNATLTPAVLKLNNIMSLYPNEWLYPSSLKEASGLQKIMSSKLILEDDFKELNIIAGMDVSNNPYDPKKLIYATIVLLNAHDLSIIEVQNSVQKAQFPYVSGFLGFREAPALIEAFSKLTHKPDLIFVDGHGVSHPRKLGIASHMGILLDCPSIGVAKNLLVGKSITEHSNIPGTQTPILWQENVIAMQLQSKHRCKPLFISSGHRISLPTSVQYVQKYLKGYRLPEPTRLAHLKANELRLMFLKEKL